MNHGGLDRVPVSVSEWLFGSFVLILFGDDEYFSCHISKEWDGNAVYGGPDRKDWLRNTRVAQLVAAWQLGCKKMEREYENEEEIEREWGNGQEMETEWGNGERFTLNISSLLLYFLPLCPFPISKNISFCRKMLKAYHTCYEKIILGRICCEKAQQVVPACTIKYAWTLD